MSQSMASHAPAPALNSWSLTEHLLSTTDPAAWRAATQAPFVRAAAEGRLSKTHLGTWLANDRLYIHAYVRAASCLLALVDLPQVLPSEDDNSGPNTETQIVDWLCEALAGVRREERWFLDAARRYHLNVNLPSDGTGLQFLDSAKLPGLLLYEQLFKSATLSVLQSRDRPPCVWLEGAVVLWATEKCYLEAWSWARTLLPQERPSFDHDADGGASRKEFIDNWSSDEFRDFVDRFGVILDKGVNEYIAKGNGQVSPESIITRIQAVWDSVIHAEMGFWPALE